MLSRVWKLTPPVGGDVDRAVYFLRTRVPMAIADPVYDREAVTAALRGRVGVWPGEALARGRPA
jgi:hypothetical protein